MRECKRYDDDDDDVDVDVDDEVHSHGKYHHGIGFSSTRGIHIRASHKQQERWQDSNIKLKWMISYVFVFGVHFFYYWIG